MKTLKRFFASIMVAVMILTAAPLSGFVGMELNLDWLDFSIESSASAVDYSDLTQNQYMAKILLNHNYDGCISPLDGDMTIPQ